MPIFTIGQETLVAVCQFLLSAKSQSPIDVTNLRPGLGRTGGKLSGMGGPDVDGLPEISALQCQPLGSGSATFFVLSRRNRFFLQFKASYLKIKK